MTQENPNPDAPAVQPPAVQPPAVQPPAVQPPAVQPPAVQPKPKLERRSGFVVNPNAEARPKATALPAEREMTSEGRKERQQKAAESAAQDPKSRAARKERSPEA